VQEPVAEAYQALTLEESLGATETARSISFAAIQEQSGWQELYDTESGQVYFYNHETGETTWTLEDVFMRRSDNLVAHDLAYDPTLDPSEEELQLRRNSEPSNFKCAAKVLEVHRPNLRQDPALLAEVESLARMEAASPSIVDLHEHQENMQWLADYVIQGQLLSAMSIARHTTSMLRGMAVAIGDGDGDESKSQQ